MRALAWLRSVALVALLAGPALAGWNGTDGSVRPEPTDCPCGAIPGKVGPNYDFEASTTPEGFLRTDGGIAAYWDGTSPPQCNLQPSPAVMGETYVRHIWTWAGEMPSQSGMCIADLSTSSWFCGGSHRFAANTPWYWDSQSHIWSDSPTYYQSTDGQNYVEMNVLLVTINKILYDSTGGDRVGNNTPNSSWTTAWTGYSNTQHTVNMFVADNVRSWKVEYPWHATAGPTSGDNCVVSCDKHQVWFTLLSGRNPGP